MKKSKCIFVFLFLSFPCFAEFVFNLTVQPYDGSEFFADGKKVQAVFVERDNSVAKVKLTLADTVSALEIRNSGFRSVTLHKDALLLKKGFAVLSRENSKYDTVKIFSTGRQPKSVTFIDAQTVAITLLDGNGCDIINIKTGEKKRISPPEEYADMRGFVESLVLKNKDELWISQMPAAAIHVFDLSSFEYKTVIKTTGKWSKVMAYNPVNNRVYLSHWQTCDISVINPDTHKEVQKIKTKTVPRGLAFSEDGKYMYCAQFEDAEGNSNCRLIKKDLASFKTVLEAGIKGAKRHIVADYKNGRLYVSDMLNAAVEVYSLKDDSLVKRIAVFSHPNTIQLSPDGKFLYVSCRGPNNPDKGYLYKGYVMGSLDVIDTETLMRIESIEAGNQPTGLDVSPDGTVIVLSDFLDHRIRIIERTD